MNLKAQAMSIKKRLSNLAKEKSLSYDHIALTFLLECLAHRITSNKTLYESLVFKGGYVGLRVYDSQRYTIDLDALLIKSKIPQTLELVKTVAEQTINDGVWFKFEEQKNLQTQGSYGGYRQVFRTGFGEIPKNLKQSQSIHFDLGIGDPVSPQKQTTTSLIEGENLSWLVYPVETIISEKIHALVDRGEGNSRSKDIFDLAKLLPKANTKNLKQSLKDCFKYRKTNLPENLVQYLKNINCDLLEKGWTNAVSSIKSPPRFKETYQLFITELEKLL